jgi:cytoskeletal protein RodZ
MGSYKVVSAPSLAVFKPGDTVYLYYTGTGFIATKDLTGAPIVTLPSGWVAVRLVDINSGVLISQETLVEGPVTTLPPATPTPTATWTSNVTSTPAATVNVTPTATTTTATPTPVIYGVTVSWSPSGLGYGSVSPPASLTNPQTVSIAQGGSLTVYFIPRAHAGKAVKTIKLDGVTVYTGSAADTTVSYTVTNVQGLRTLAATFG